MIDREAFDAWVATRPESIQRLAREFPVGSVFVLPGRTLHLVGYAEAAESGSDFLLVSEVDPHVDYEAAFASREPLCPEHVRRWTVRVDGAATGG